MRQHFVILCFLLCFIINAAAGFLHGQTAQAVNPNVTQELVHFGDIIDVDIVGGFEFDWRGTLNPEGFLEGLDAYGETIYGLCRSETQIAEDVAKAYRKILRSPKVEVRIIDRSNRALVRLDGAVRTPSRFQLRRNIGLRELLVLAGGLTDAASGGIIIFRPSNLSCRPSDDKTSAAPQDNGSQTLNIKISDLLGGKADASPDILSGDIITVTRASPIYVIGAVNNARLVYTPSQITVSRAVAMAGGVSKQADGGKVTIFRRTGNESTIINADLDKIRITKSGDEILQPFDIIDVAAKGASKRKYPPVAAPGSNNDGFRGELPLRVVD